MSLKNTKLRTRRFGRKSRKAAKKRLKTTSTGRFFHGNVARKHLLMQKTKTAVNASNIELHKSDKKKAIIMGV